jgi:hypothetical protein
MTIRSGRTIPWSRICGINVANFRSFTSDTSATTVHSTEESKISVHVSLPPMLSPTLPPLFRDLLDELPRALSPSLPGAFQNASPPTPLPNLMSSPPSTTKRKSVDTPNDSTPTKISRKSPPPSITPPSTKKSVSLDEYKKRKIAMNGPATPTFPKTVPADQLDSPRQNSVQPKPASVGPDAAQIFTEQSQE